jgi:hypothetical protein
MVVLVLIIIAKRTGVDQLKTKNTHISIFIVSNACLFKTFIQELILINFQEIFEINFAHF